MKRTAALLTTLCLALAMAAADADPPPADQAKTEQTKPDEPKASQTKEDQANEVRDEIAVRHMTCIRGYGSNGACGADDNGCNETLTQLRDFQVDLADPTAHKRAVYRWWRYVSGAFNAGCMRALMSTNTYCKAVRLVKAFDPHTNCPSGGGTNATCWVNADYETGPLLQQADKTDWMQSCPLTE
jgi:hypothetical protein